MVNGPVPGMLNLIVSAVVLLSALTWVIAPRSDPVPEWFVFVTVKTDSSVLGSSPGTDPKSLSGVCVGQYRNHAA